MVFLPRIRDMSALRAELERLSTMLENEEEGIALIQRVLEESQPRPGKDAKQGEKNQYAVRFADKIGEFIAKDLEPRFKGIQATTRRGLLSQAFPSRWAQVPS
jgi:hypothetical protein